MTTVKTSVDPHAWLDKHIAEQAAFYGLTPEKKAEIFQAAAEYDEFVLDSEPREWADLWDAMAAAPTAWIETTEKMYWEMLEVLPPRCMEKRKFLVGEAHHDNEHGQTVYAGFKQVGSRFYARYLTVDQFAFV